uniref:Uncharacterized protein n=1 Tax=viral metagenome TaxID=1070528 RepID=A0A6C0D3Q0_9ZZZZ
MGLRETKKEVIVKRQRQSQPHFKLKTKRKRRKVTRKLKIKLRLKFKLKPLKRIPSRLLPIPIKKGNSNIKPLSAHANSLSKVLESAVPNNIHEIKAMCAILGMHLSISPKEQVTIENKYEQILEKLIEIYSKLEMKPYRVKILNDFKEELKKSKSSTPVSNKHSESKSLKLESFSKNKSLKLESFSKNKSKNKSLSKSKSKNKFYGGRVVHLQGDWDDYPPLPSMTYRNCVSSSYRLLNLLNAEDADELGRETAGGIATKATINWLNEIYGEDHYLIRFWTKGQVVDDYYMEELDNFFMNLFPAPNTGTMVHILGHFFNVVRNSFGKVVFYDLQGRWVYENEDANRQYYWTIRFQDFYEYFLEKMNNSPIIEVVCQNYMLPEFEPTNANYIEAAHFRYGRKYALNEAKKAIRNVGNSPQYYNPDENGNGNGNGNGNNDNQEWGEWHDSYYRWYEYSMSELKAIINGRTRIKFSELERECAGRYFYYRYGWDGIVPVGNSDEDEGEVYEAPYYPIAYGADTYAEWGTPLIMAIEIEHDRYNFDVYDSNCDIGKYGEVDLPTHNDIRYDYDTLWMTWSYMKYIRFWINEYMFGNYKITTYTVEQLERMLLVYKHKNNKLIEEIPYYSTAIEDYSSPIYRDAIGVGRSNLLYATQKQLQNTVNLLSTFISNIKAVINAKLGRRIYTFNQKEVNRGKIEKLFRKEASIVEFRKITGDDRGCRFTKYGKGYRMFGGSGHMIGGSAAEKARLKEERKARKAEKKRVKQEKIAAKENGGAGGWAENEEEGDAGHRMEENGTAMRPTPKPRKRKPKQPPKQTDIIMAINSALDPSSPNQKACEDYIRSPSFESRMLCEPRQNMEYIVTEINKTWGDDIPNLALRIVRVINPLLDLFEFTDLPALTILEYIYTSTQEEKEALVGEKFVDSIFFDKAVEYIFTEEFFDKALNEDIDWAQFDSFSDEGMSEEEIKQFEEIQEHIHNMASRYHPDYVIVEEVYGEYSGGYLNSLIPIYISETIIQKPLMSDEARAAVSAYMATDEYYTPEYIENIRTKSWPIDEGGFRRRTGGSMYEYYAYEDPDLY